MVAPDDKQNRLSTLSQDVIAVPKKPPAKPAAPEPAAKRAPERPAERPVEKPVEKPPERVERKEIPASQDVFKVNTQSQPALSMPTPASPRAARPAARPPGAELPPVTLAIGAAAGLALLLAAYAVFAGGGGGSSAASDEKVAKLEVELKAANERVAKLEAKLSAASTDAQKLGAPGQGNVLVLSAGIRDLRDDLDMVSNEVAAVSTQVGELRTLAGGSSKDAKMALAQIEQVGARVATLNQQIAGMPRGGGGGGGGGGGDAQAQLKALAQKTDKMAADIRQLYRQVGSQ